MSLILILILIGLRKSKCNIVIRVNVIDTNILLLLEFIELWILHLSNVYNLIVNVVENHQLKKSKDECLTILQKEKPVIASKSRSIPRTLYYLHTNSRTLSHAPMIAKVYKNIGILIQQDAFLILDLGI